MATEDRPKENVPIYEAVFKPIYIFLKKVYKEVKEFSSEEKNEKPVSQDEYFSILLRQMIGTTDKIRIFGYDDEFMKRPDTIYHIKRAIKGKGANREGSPVYISAIFPENVKDVELEKLAQESSFLNILRVVGDMREGIIIFDSNEVTYWNKDKETLYPPERDKGIIFRTPKFNIRKYIQEYDDIESKIRDKQK